MITRYKPETVPLWSWRSVRVVAMDIVLVVTAFLWITAHMTNPVRYRGWFTLPPVSRATSDTAWRSQIVLAVMPQETLSEVVFSRILAKACPLVVTEVARLTAGFYCQQPAKEPSDLGLEIELVVELAGLWGSLQRMELRALEGSFEVLPCPTIRRDLRPRPPTRTITVSESGVVERGPIPVIVIPTSYGAVEPRARGQSP